MRPRSPSRLAVMLALALVAFFSSHGIGQDVQLLPPIDRGLVERVSQSPDSPETKLRASIHALNGPAERVGSSGAPYLAGKLIVKFRDGISPASRLAALSERRAKETTQPSYANFEVISLDADEDVEVAAHALAASADVEYAQPAYRVHANFIPNDPLYSKQWNLPDIDLERAWDIQPDAGSTITVAVLDTGIAYTNVTRSYRARAFHVNGAGDVVIGGPGVLYPALGDLTLAFAAAPELGASTRFVSPHDFIWDTDVPVDLNGHGTHVSGTIGQLTNNNVGVAGVAFNVKLMPVKVLDGEWDVIFSAPNVATDDSVARGIRYAADNGAKVINMSLGRSGTAGSAPVVEDAMKYAIGKGAFVVVAAVVWKSAERSAGRRELDVAAAARIERAIVIAIDRRHRPGRQRFRGRKSHASPRRNCESRSRRRVEVRVMRWIWVSADAHVTHVTGILGSGGISKDAAEDDAGGVAARFRVLVGW